MDFEWIKWTLHSRMPSKNPALMAVGSNPETSKYKPVHSIIVMVWYWHYQSLLVIWNKLWDNDWRLVCFAHWKVLFVESSIQWICVRNISMWFLTNLYSFDHTCPSFSWLVHIVVHVYTSTGLSPPLPCGKDTTGQVGQHMSVVHVHVHGTVLSCPIPCGKGQGRWGHVISMWLYMCISIFLSCPFLSNVSRVVSAVGIQVCQ